MKKGFTLTEFLITLAIVGIIFAAALIPFAIGAGGFGPTNKHVVTVTRLYVDHSGSGDSATSHYMVGTDKGVFEVDNGILLGIWNADELYASLRENHRYSVVTKGNRVVSWYAQEYPYIIQVTPYTDTSVENKR